MIKMDLISRIFNKSYNCENYYKLAIIIQSIFILKNL